MVMEMVHYLYRWKVQINHLKHFGMRRPRKVKTVWNYAVSFRKMFNKEINECI